jgi:cellulose 1,4-beta-cellobiosidase
MIDNSFTKFDSLTKLGNSVSDEFCVAQRKAFGENDSFAEDSGFPQLGATLNKGHALALSLWDDRDVNMLWLEFVCPTNSSKAGSDRGPGKNLSGVPPDVESQAARLLVKCSDICLGAIDSTCEQAKANQINRSM